jgi:hypothetical protein
LAVVAAVSTTTWPAVMRVGGLISLRKSFQLDPFEVAAKTSTGEE